MKMNNKEIYRIWAPYGKKWVDWVRPVPFVSVNEYSRNYNYMNMMVPKVNYLDDSYEGAAIIVDLPGAESVMEGLGLARKGYRPIPIYNGTIEQKDSRATVDNQTVGAALVWGAAQLSQIEIKDDALPVFLLDKNRMNRFKMQISLFDNSWDIYHQDLPSAEYFIENNIKKIIIIGSSVSKDLKKILYGFQKKKIQIYLAKNYDEPKIFRIRKQFQKDI
ncbi:MAG: hypothetical protein IJC76_05195 [Lachnospiraceae bacterium]|nr:hypothetical protein [Lachnospiraceae bacterium]